MRLPTSLPTSVKPTVLAGIAAVTVVASLTASVTGAVRPVRSRSGRLYRPPSAVHWRVPHLLVRADDRTSMRDAIAVLRSETARTVVARTTAPVAAPSAVGSEVGRHAADAC